MLKFEVYVKKHKRWNPENINYEDIDGIAILHQFGVDTYDGGGSYSTAIVEYENGTFDNVSLCLLTRLKKR